MPDETPVRPGDLTDEQWWEPQRAAQQAATDAAWVDDPLRTTITLVSREANV